MSRETEELLTRGRNVAALLRFEGETEWGNTVRELVKKIMELEREKTDREK